MTSYSSKLYLLILVAIISYLFTESLTNSKHDDNKIKIQNNTSNKINNFETNNEQKPIENTEKQLAIAAKEPELNLNAKEIEISKYSDPFTNNKSYEWLLTRNKGYKKSGQQSLNKDEVIDRILQLYPMLSLKLLELNDGLIFMLSALPQTDFEYLLKSAPTGIYIFQHGRFIKNTKDKNFDKKSLFCILKINYNPDTTAISKTSTYIKIGKPIALLTEYLPYKGVRLISDRKNTEDQRIINSIDCLIPAIDDKNYESKNLQILHLAYSIGAHVYYH